MGNILKFTLSNLVAGFILATIFIFVEIESTNISGFLEKNSDVTPVIRALLLSFFTILGILSRIIYENIYKNEKKDKNSKNSMYEIVVLSYKSKEFWYSLLASPIIIISFYKTIMNIESYTLLALFSYQNGFFFRSLLSGSK